MELFSVFSSMELKKILFFYQIPIALHDLWNRIFFLEEKKDFIYIAFVKLHWNDSMKE